jgi:TonB family protein
MPTVQPRAPDLANRRMATGMLLSLLLHVVILSIQFGLPGKWAGGAGPMTVRLTPAPAPASSLPPELPAPASSPAASAVPAPAPPDTPSSGLRLVDPMPMAPPPQSVAKPVKRRRSQGRSKAPRGHASTPPVIVRQDNPDAAFKVPLAESQVEPGPEPAPVPESPVAPEPVAAQDEAVPDERAAEVTAAAAREEQQRLANEEARRLAQLHEQEAERQRVAAAEREQGRLADEERRQAVERLAAERAQEARLAGERTAALHRQAQAQAERERQLEEAAARAGLLASEREAERELAAQRQAAQLAQQREEELARQRAEQLARQQLEEDRARRQRAEQAATQAVQEELARQQAIQQARQQAHEAAEAERARQAAQAEAAGNGGSPGTAPGNGADPGGTLPRPTLGGAALASRARELLRGIDVPGAPPAALRPAQQLAEGRRRVVDTLERDVPLRLYVDSFRQKIERNAAQIRMQLPGGPGRADPLVSIALRSDGSVDDVTIVRSSGRPDADEAVRRIVHLNARYAAFPPNVAARFDVIEIRRIWRFSETLKLLEEVR